MATEQQHLGETGWSEVTRRLNAVLCSAWTLVEGSEFDPTYVRQAVSMLQRAAPLRRIVARPHSIQPGTRSSLIERVPVLTEAEWKLVQELVEQAIPESDRQRYRHLVKLREKLRFTQAETNKL